jgi:type IV pilus assembly protein PilY1
MSTSFRRVFENRLLRFIFGAILFLTLSISALYQVKNLFADDNTPCKTPPFLTAAVPPMVMLVVSKDHTNYSAAYSDNQKLKPGTDTIQKTYDNSIDYYGYFDSAKCYTYDTAKYFVPSVSASNHLCSNAWSGNFLNWVSMTRMDALRKVLYGGHRGSGSGDNATSTILERAYIPAEGHAWVKVYNGNDGRPAISSLTPYTPTDGNLTMMNVTCNSFMDQCVGAGLRDMPILRVADGNFYDWDLAETCVGYFRGENGACSSGDNDVARRNPLQTKRLADLAVRVKACVPGLLGNEMCKEYTPGSGKYKPIGLLQKYGDTEAMHFGLITGSYAKNTSGGVLRKRIRSFANEINPNTGEFTGSQGIVSTLSKLRLIDYGQSNTGYYNGCTYGVPMTEGSQGCRNWGNPIGEMLYEALRYYAGANSPTSVFNADDSSLTWSTTGATGSPYTLSLPKDSWNDPYGDGNATYNHPYCSKPYILVVSDIYPSYDDNQLPGSAFSSFTGDTTHLPGMDVTALASTITTNDPNATNPGVSGKYFVGNVVGGNATYANTCSDKDVGNLGAVKGFCPGYAGVNGTFYSAGVAYYGRINDLRPSLSGKPSTVKISPVTMAVALSDPLPVIEIKTSNGKLSISPIIESRWSGNPSYVSMGSYLKAKYKTPPTGYDGEIEITWENTYQASDYDLDLAHRIRWKKGTGADDVVVEDALWSKKAGAQMKAGYVASGSTTDGKYMDLLADYSSNYTYPQFAPNDWAAPTTGNVQCPDTNTPHKYCTFSTRTFTTKSTSTAKSLYLKTPLWYAAKWGGFTDLDSDNMPNNPDEWNKNRFSDPNQAGVPDNYFFVENPNTLFQSLDKAFSAVLQREGAAGAVATVTQEVHESDIVVRAAFETFSPTNPSVFTWMGHLEAYKPYDTGCAELTTGPTCTAITGCKWNGSVCSGSIYSFQLPRNAGLFCGQITSDANCIDSAVELNAQNYSSRDIFTYKNGARQVFSALTSSTDNATTLKVHKDFDGSGAVNSADFDLLKDWVRGSAAVAKNLRDRQNWKLADIVYSTPVTVGPPTVSALPRQLADDNFRTFLGNNAQRDAMVYVGANDGMLHAFNLGFWDSSKSEYVYDNATLFPTTGQERWAYVPSNLLSELQCLAVSSYGTTGTGACAHRFTVDLSPQVWDVKINNSSGVRTWTSVLLGGERSGGDTYFALDVTSPDAADVSPIWEYSVLKNYPVVAGANATLLASTYYDAMKTLPLSWSLPYVGRLRDSANGTQVAFVGGGIREFRPDQITVAPGVKLNQVGGTFWRYLYYPTFHAITLNDGNGTDVWKDDWTTLLATPSFQSAFPVSTASTPVLPYAVGNVAAYDLFDSNGRSVTRGGMQDGFTDLLYAGDLNGTFYTMVMNSAGTAPTLKPSCIVGRKVQPVVNANANPYRGKRQPISATPVAALDADKNLRVYFGAGKFDDTPSGSSDKTDNATMSFYCLVENLAAPLGNETSTRCAGDGLSITTTTPFKFSYMNCSDENNGTRRFSWVKKNADNTTSPDGGTCFQAIFDLLNPGERIIGNALVAAGRVYFTTFVPDSGPCKAGGSGRLYVLDYMGRPLPDPDKIIVQGGGTVSYYDVNSKTWSSSPPSSVGAIVVALPDGISSPPVLGSDGKLFIQTSTAAVAVVQTQEEEGKRSKIEGWGRQD